MCNITFVNHASVLIEAEGIRLITDPWLEGRVFHNGWDLIAKSKFSFDDFADITHIWFSHEHPDHFFPPNVKRIPEAMREKICILYQQTADQKVVDYCRNLGFRTQELPHHKWVELTPGFRVLCGPVPVYDSWLMLDAGGKCIVNLNDCELNQINDIEPLQQYLPRPVDLLLSQFGYASWKGNPEEKQAREDGAREILERLGAQASVLKPRYLLPFASLIYFCHEENSYLNDSINTIAGAAEYIQNQTQATPVVMYPGETWSIGQLHDNAEPLARWQADYETIPRDLQVSQTVSWDDLQKHSAAYLARMREKNNRLLVAALSRIGFFPQLKIHLWDLDRVVAFDLRRGISPSDASAEDADVAMSSESLAFIFQFDWGMDTVYVNGRFRAAPEGFSRFIRTFALGIMNNTGRRFGFGLILDWQYTRQSIVRLVRLLRGRKEAIEEYQV
ncbi:MAG: MBL fold metallo-hydrolase [Planctomycetales bacterium]|nr:MBL fold metallo-hydrolase [Planctomycetales bacterium]